MLPCLHVHRNCLCLYRDPKNVERFAIAIQCMSIICVKNLKNLNNLFKKEESPAAAKVEKDEKDSVKSEGGNEDSPNEVTCDAESGVAPPSVADSPIKSEAERLNPEEMEKMLQYMAKVFILQFPLYSGPKQASLR